MKAIKFNTWRQYTPEGQIIVAWVHSEEEDKHGTTYCVRFFDMSRNITGEISFCHNFIPAHILEVYDEGGYREVSHMPGVEEEKALALAATA